MARQRRTSTCPTACEGYHKDPPGNPAATLETFDWSFNAQYIDRGQMEELATGDVIRRQDNLLFVGQSGLGKSHLMEAIGRRCCAAGCRVRCLTSAELLLELGKSLADGTMPKRVRYYAGFDLLIIDEFGFDKLEREDNPRASSLLYKMHCFECDVHGNQLDLWSQLHQLPLRDAAFDLGRRLNILLVDRHSETQ